ncbi:hypothetical protein L249_0349 [Ophiocordyceps polyrhachis-furcata BCC 54312]|uniref:Uncharacterized protein n=1 Tax=Ophiocordyceps polyrhachis-furcata BCC 54312 TaxID=1330021 RepID=A0A367LFU0_9HYPO|nr:hypothetical protein L249_0349 [Ophiocordyceps polyrhachis-furcata BCC 54312]
MRDKYAEPYRLTIDGTLKVPCPGSLVSAWLRQGHQRFLGYRPWSSPPAREKIVSESPTAFSHPHASFCVPHYRTQMEKKRKKERKTIDDKTIQNLLSIVAREPCHTALSRMATPPPTPPQQRTTPNHRPVARGGSGMLVLLFAGCGAASRYCSSAPLLRIPVVLLD